MAECFMQKDFLIKYFMKKLDTMSQMLLYIEKSSKKMLKIFGRRETNFYNVNVKSIFSIILTYILDLTNSTKHHKMRLNMSERIVVVTKSLRTDWPAARLDLSPIQDIKTKTMKEPQKSSIRQV